MRRPLALLFFTLFIIGQAKAGTIFSFSFVDDFNPTDVVSGTLVLPDGDGVGLAATTVTVNVAPAALGYILPLDVMSLGPVGINSFDVVAGNIVSADFQSGDGVNQVFTLTNQATSSDLSSPDYSVVDFAFINGLSTTFERIGSTESGTASAPASILLFGLGLAGIGLLKRRRQLVAS